MDYLNYLVYERFWATKFLPCSLALAIPDLVHSTISSHSKSATINKETVIGMQVIITVSNDAIDN